MLQLVHWTHRLACSNCCTCHTDQHAPSVALATQISMFQVLHWPHGSACSKCCTGHANQRARAAALATQIDMLHLQHWPRRSTCSKHSSTRADQHALNDSVDAHTIEYDSDRIARIASYVFYCQLSRISIVFVSSQEAS